MQIGHLFGFNEHREGITAMNMKQKIWTLPILAILISFVSITAIYLYSNTASNLLGDIEQRDYPALNEFNILISQDQMTI